MLKAYSKNSDGTVSRTYLNDKTGELKTYTTQPRSSEEKISFKAGLKKGRKEGRKYMFGFLRNNGGLSQKKLKEINDFTKKNKKK